MPGDIDRLLDRNARWAERMTAADPTYFVRMAERQTPEYFWIGCSDSRVTANDVLDLAPGSVFVQRNIANIVHTGDLNLLSALEFAVDHLKVKHIMVCGHYYCGGIARAICERRGALTDHWLQPVTMFYRKHRALFDALGDGPARLHSLSEVNVEMQVRRLASTPIVENAWARGQSLTLHGWVYGVDDGRLRDLGPTLSTAEQRDVLPSIDERVRTLGVARKASRFVSGPSQQISPQPPLAE